MVDAGRCFDFFTDNLIFFGGSFFSGVPAFVGSMLEVSFDISFDTLRLASGASWALTLVFAVAAPTLPVLLMLILILAAFFFDPPARPVMLEPVTPAGRVEG